MRLALPPGMQELDQSAVASQFVKDLVNPVAKADVLREAGKAKLADEIVASLRRLPERTFEDAADLTQALNAV
ncbi:MAG: DUF2795 domain-containing protein [Chloroflexi bacterium]|nr:MAG: DUF2795 domain-containing protein [Chloroflexota bacterium]